MTLQKDGAEEADLEKVKKMFIRERETNLERNRWWTSLLLYSLRYGEDPTNIYLLEEKVMALDKEAIKTSANKYFNMGQYVQMVLLPE